MEPVCYYPYIVFWDLNKDKFTCNNFYLGIVYKRYTKVRCNRDPNFFAGQLGELPKDRLEKIFLSRLNGYFQSK